MTYKASKTTYTQDELMSSTEIVRHFSSVLNLLKNNKRKKIGILRKNKIEAVILPIKEYEAIAQYFLHFSENEEKSLQQSMKSESITIQPEELDNFLDITKKKYV